MVRLDTPSARNSRAGFRPRSPKTVGRSSWERRAPFSAQQKACYIAYADPGHYTLARIEGRQTHHHAACRTQPLSLSYGNDPPARSRNLRHGAPVRRGRRISRRTPNAPHPRQRQPAYKREKAATCVYRRGSTLVFIIAGYIIHFGYGILLIDAGRRGSRAYTFTLSQVGNGAALGL